MCSHGGNLLVYCVKLVLNLCTALQVQCLGFLSVTEPLWSMVFISEMNVIAGSGGTSAVMHGSVACKYWWCDID